MCGGSLENDYTPQEKKDLLESFKESDKKMNELIQETKNITIIEKPEEKKPIQKINEATINKPAHINEEKKSIQEKQKDSNEEAERVKKMIDETTKKTNAVLDF